MAARLKVICDELDGNWIRVTISIPARRNGELNLGMLTAINAALLPMRPDAYDPDPQDVPAPQLAHNDGHTAGGGGLIAPDIAAAMIRDRVIATDEAMGAPGEPPRCKTGGCDE